jgi:hypothetical protein
VQGILSLMSIVPAQGRIEIGHVTFGASMQRSPKSTEAVYLLAREIFALGYRRLEWKCNNANARSKYAAERLGFTFEGVFRQHMVVKGQNRDTAWYSMLDSEWPAIGAGFERWLSEANQTESGQVRGGWRIGHRLLVTERSRWRSISQYIRCLLTAKRLSSSSRFA